MDRGSSDDELYIRSMGSLETTEIPVVEPGNPGSSPGEKPPRHKKPLGTPIKRLASILAAIIIVLGVGAGGTIFIRKNSKKSPTTIVVNTQSLDNGTLNQLTAQADGALTQQLTISPDTIFKSSVDIQKSASLGENLTVGGSSLLKGPVTMQDSLQISKSLTVSGTTTIGNNLSVGGQISAGSMSVGTLTLSSINLSNNLTFAGHLIPNGSTPTVRASVASGGGSVVITGNDTSGTVTINIGSGGSGPGEMAIITFNAAYNTTPKVQLTPITASASALRYYATRNPRFFTIDTSSAPSSGASYVFDYFVTQ